MKLYDVTSPDFKTQPIPGFNGQFLAWAHHEGQLIYWHGMGPKTVLEALWALTISSRVFQIATVYGEVIRPIMVKGWGIRKEDDTRLSYFFRVANVRHTPWKERLGIHIQSTEDAVDKAPAYFLVPTGTFDAMRFFSLWNRVVPLPAHDSWSNYLFDEGRRKGLVTMGVGYNVDVWKIQNGVDEWKRIVEAALEDIGLPAPAPVVAAKPKREYHAPKPKPAPVEVEVEAKIKQPEIAPVTYTQKALKKTTKHRPWIFKGWSVNGWSKCVMKAIDHYGFKVTAIFDDAGEVEEIARGFVPLEGAAFAELKPYFEQLAVKFPSGRRAMLGSGR